MSMRFILRQSNQLDYAFINFENFFSAKELVEENRAIILKPLYLAFTVNWTEPIGKIHYLYSYTKPSDHAFKLNTNLKKVLETQPNKFA